MDKKIIIIGIVIVVVVLGGLAIWKYSMDNDAMVAPNQETNTESNQTQEQENNEIQIQVDGISAKGSDGSSVQGGLLVCVDKCGDGVCQKADTACAANSSNCVCAETKAECAQDCK